ncbi:MAG: sensor histidine kinase [Nitrosotalea sp.]
MALSIQGGIEEYYAPPVKNSKFHSLHNEFINIASHEIKTPVQSILTYSELLHAKPEENHAEYIEAIYRNALRLQKLTKNLLEVARIGDRALKLRYQKFDIDELSVSIIRDFVKQMEHSGRKTNDVKFLFVPNGPIIVHADKDRISQVISNLLDNAFKFTHKGNTLLRINQTNETVVVSVEDSGSGISPEVASRLFSKFTTSYDVGTGLGLYISKNIIEAHGGRILAINKPNNTGAIFSFEIPTR